MDFQKMINDINEASRVSKRGKAMSPYDIIEELDGRDSTYNVIFSNGSTPGEFHSYRGSYCELALSSQSEGKDLGTFINECKKVNGAVFEGWKGGDFRMDISDVIHISEEGCCGEEYIQDISIDEENNNIVLNLVKLDLD